MKARGLACLERRVFLLETTHALLGPLQTPAQLRLARHLGYVPQAPTLFAGTVAENIARFAGEYEENKVVERAI